jgi:hypothetical protein
MPDPERPRPDPAVAWNEVQGYLDRFFDALNDPEEGGVIMVGDRRNGAVIVELRPSLRYRRS